MEFKGDIYVQISFLKKYNVVEETIYNGMSKFRKFKSKYYHNIVDEVDSRCRWIKYSTLPPTLVNKYKLPQESSIANSLKRHESQKLTNLIKDVLNHAYHVDYRLYLNQYKAVFSNECDFLSFARNIQC